MKKITFINGVVGRGVFNNVINLQLGAFLFDPTADGKISEELTTVSRLRMDIPAARDLHKHLTQLLELVDDAKSRAAAPTPVGVVAEEAQSGKPN